jgi:hypothetical protein
MPVFRSTVRLLAGFFALVSVAGASELTDRIRAEAQACADALFSGDYGALIARTHPKIVAEMGGREQAVAAVEQGVASMFAEGVTIEGVTIGQPSAPVASGALVALFVPQTIILKSPQGRFRKPGHLLAVSEDGGGSWSFIDCSQLDAHSLQQYFPELADRINLPPPQGLEPIGG